jgi:phosphatidylserine decarboxylase
MSLTFLQLIIYSQHLPSIHTVLSRRNIAAYLSPVKPSYVMKYQDVFKANERVNVFGHWNEDCWFFFQSFAGALNVDSILLDFDS